MLTLYDVTALVGRAAVFPRHLRPALRAYGSEPDDQIHLVVTTPSGDLILRGVAPALEAEARTFATRLNAASAELRRSRHLARAAPMVKSVSCSRGVG